jgi:hypothetical protein
VVTVAPQCEQFSGYKRLLALLMELKLVAQNISKRYIQYLSESQTCCQSKIDIQNDFKDIRAHHYAYTVQIWALSALK